MNEEEPEELPEGWARATLGEQVYYAGRIGWRGLKAEEYTKSGPLLLSVHGLNRGEHVAFDEADHISSERYRESPEIMLQENDVLLAKDGAGIGKLGIVVGLPSEATINSSLLLIRPFGALVPKYLYYNLAGPKMQELVKSRITGSATPHLFQKDIKTFEIAVPPLREQRRIVAAVEAVLAKVNAARDRLNRVPTILKRFRQAVLSAACSGRLSADSRGDDKDQAEAELPSGWQQVALGSISTKVTDGTHQPPPLAERGGIPFVLIGNVVNLKIEWDGVRKWVSQETYERLTARCKPERGDVLYTAVGATFGQALKVETDQPFIFQRHIAHIKPQKDRVDSGYLVHVLNSQEQYRHACEVARGAAQPTVTLSDLKEFQIPVPPLTEQNEIVRRVDALFAFTDLIETRLADARQMVNQLTQAVLAKAFRGELVPTEAALARREKRPYEPAADLLARIRTEREKPADAASKPTRTRKPRASEDC